MIIRLFWVCLLLSLSWSKLAAEPSLRVVGLFADAALVEVDGQRTLLKKSNEPINGLRLISATAKEAEIEIAGKVKKFTLDQGIAGSYQRPRSAKVVIAKDNYDRYLTTGSINGLPVTLLVDTGATAIAMNRTDAERLGIDFRLQGSMGQAITASGVTRTYQVVLEKVKVGEIELKQVEAAIIDGEYPKTILLGMSFLQHVDMHESKGTLELTKDY